MPSGNTHTKANLALACAATAAIYYILPKYTSISPRLGVHFVVGGAILASDWFLSPDLDGERSNAKRHWWIMRWIWGWYERFPHRHPLTHWPMISDALRLGYLCVMAAAIWAIYDFLLRLQQIILLVYGWCMAHPYYAVAIFAGCSAATACHAILDFAVSEGKKMVD